MQRDFPDRPIVGVGVVVWRGDRVLLIRRGKPPRAGQWSLPGGAQELGETVAATARREVLEETGLELSALELLTVVDLIEQADPSATGPATGPDHYRYHYTLIDFVAEAAPGAPFAAGDAADVAWFERASLPGLGLWDETLRIIDLAARRRPGTSSAFTVTGDEEGPRSPGGDRP
jgi:ADP-ribose pyrophosphatase YjhB (NUDIX family)